jgi:protein-tyrosine phosphatase
MCMEYLKSIYSVAYDKIIHQIYRENNKIKPLRQFDEDDFLKKLNSYLFSNPTLIIDNLYLGNGNNAANLDTLNQFNIEVIVNVTKELENYFENKFIYQKYEILDEKDNDISIYFDNFLKLVEENKNKNILIHCFMGSSRSASLVLLYLLKVKKFNLDESIKFLKEKRDIVNINIDFLNQIKNYLI